MIASFSTVELMGTVNNTGVITSASEGTQCNDCYRGQ